MNLDGFLERRGTTIKKDKKIKKQGRGVMVVVGGALQASGRKREERVSCMTQSSAARRHCILHARGAAEAELKDR